MGSVGMTLQDQHSMLCRSGGSGRKVSPCASLLQYLQTGGETTRRRGPNPVQRKAGAGTSQVLDSGGGETDQAKETQVKSLLPLICPRPLSQSRRPVHKHSRTHAHG